MAQDDDDAGCELDLFLGSTNSFCVLGETLDTTRLAPSPLGLKLRCFFAGRLVTLR